MCVCVQLKIFANGQRYDRCVFDECVYARVRAYMRVCVNLASYSLRREHSPKCNRKISSTSAMLPPVSLDC